MQTFNPFLPEDVYIADGEPHVFGDRVYLFGSHDKEGGDSFCLENYEFFSAPIDDLGNWTSKGINYAADQDAKRGTRITYKYFDFEKEVSLTVTARGKGTIEAYVGKESAGLMDFHSEKWSKKTLALKQCCSKKALSFFVKKGCLDVLSFELRG